MLLVKGNIFRDVSECEAKRLIQLGYKEVKGVNKNSVGAQKQKAKIRKDD